MASETTPPANAGDPSPCPAWFKEGPERGSGEPPAVRHVPRVADVLVCSYEGPPPMEAPQKGAHPSSDLVAEKQISSQRWVASLARQINKSRPYVPQNPPAGSRLCPPETAGRFYMRFRYQGGAELSVVVIRSGCRRVVAGKRGPWLHLSRRVERTLVEVTEVD